MNTALLIKREGLLACRHMADWVHTLLVYGLLIGLFPLGISSSPQVLAELAPGILWFSVIFISILGAPRLFADEIQSGSIYQWLNSAVPLSVLVAIKVMVHWLVMVIPLLLLLPIFATLYGLSFNTLGYYLLSLILGTPSLIYGCAIIQALTLSLRQQTIMLAFLLFPLLVPVIILGVMAIDSSGLFSTPSRLLLSALMVLSLTVGPFVCASALRLTVLGQHSA